VEEGQAGLVIEPESSASLCAAVLKLANNPELGRQLGANGQRYVAAHFDRRVLARRFEGVLTALRDQAEQPERPALRNRPAEVRESGVRNERHG